ncbi:DUF2335 domain-containing protein [Orbaceae bacterium ESL0727]|nr:DUF2335 domain-containing protein [Orbaceae bacterium ESL0727]
MPQTKNKNLPINKNNLQKDCPIVLQIEKEIENNPNILEELLERPSIQKMVFHKSESYSGPLPHPDILKKYNELDPDFSKTIFAHFKEEQEHRHRIDNKAIDGAILSDKRAQYMAFFICIIVLGISFYAVYSGKEVAGIIGLVMSLGGLIAAFLKGNNNSNNNN